MNRTEKKVKEAQEEIGNADYFYLDDKVQDYQFSDYIKMTSYPRGIVFSFGKYFPEKRKFGIFTEIMMPFEVADALRKMIEDHIEDLKKQGRLKDSSIEDGKQGE